MKYIILLFVSAVLITGCKSGTTNKQENTLTIETHQGVSFSGEDLMSVQIDPIIDSVRISNYLHAKKEFEANPNNADALIWAGRRLAYLGDYKNAIKIFSEGVKNFPNDARMYRHRGHRYISLRQLDFAIIDFEKAAKLIEGEEDQVEPDGIPNERNTPVSTTHRNIWYHLGLAYYLKDDMENALRGFGECRDISTNPDMFVASSHWVYMILRRMGRTEDAAKILDPITKDMDVFENMSYHSLLLFAKGEISEDELLGDAEEVSTANNAVVYGLGNWYFYNGDSEKARSIFEDLVDKGIWAAFGTIAAEADLERMGKME